MIVHSSLSSFGYVIGGAKAVVDALLVTFSGVMAPAFTYQTMVVPETGPPGNGIAYAHQQNANRLAKPWSFEMPVDRLMGEIPETLRTHRKASRSQHPILSFTGVGVEAFLNAQDEADPFRLLEALAGATGWCLLIGVGHSVNTTLHFAEQLAGRKVFTRWALTNEGVRACSNFPGCSNGFDEMAIQLDPITRRTTIGDALVRALPLNLMIEIARAAFEKAPHGYLCKRADCGRCDAVRRSV